MQAHRLVESSSVPIFISLDPPFSGFDYIDTHFSWHPAIHRCFSLARSFGAKTLIQEQLPPTGILFQENEELATFGLASGRHTIIRVSFWDCRTAASNITSQTDSNLIGYMILKKDEGIWKGTPFSRWHVFEAAFRKYAHAHNCVPNTGIYSVRICGTVFRIKGVLYCQQNGLNKSCAHVALRSLLSRLVPEHDVSYTTLNAIAKTESSYHPSNGLGVEQIRNILQYYNIAFHDVDYNESCKNYPDIRKTQPYQKYLYSGVESGMGGLLGFSMDGPKAADGQHIIPFYGHTFNKDTWTPDADVSYFNIGANIRYIPSESWTSSFLGHDDNFGANFCVPRLYVKPENVQYVVELLRKGATYNGMIAEAIALQLLDSLRTHFDNKNIWQTRLKKYVRAQQVVLRTFCALKEEYLGHLRHIRDWNGNQETPAVLSALEAELPALLWIVEFSIPQLFPANERKLGEIVLNANRPPSDVFSLFSIARLPGNYLTLPNKKKTSYECVPSQLQSHVEVMQQND